MDIRTRSPSLSAPIQMKQEQTPPPQDKISAYYSLVFPHFTFYIQTLSVTIGRRCAPNPNTATSSTAEPAAVDVDLGALKSVSRLHAKIEFDQDEDRFVLAVIGRNGAWVDGVWSASGTRAPLGERSVRPSNPDTSPKLTRGWLQVPNTNCITHVSLCSSSTSSARRYSLAKLAVI